MAMATDWSQEELTALINGLKRLLGELADIRIQAEQLIASLRASQRALAEAVPSDEDLIREAIAEAQDHPGRTITR
jgi:hypothetical protein